MSFGFYLSHDGAADTLYGGWRRELWSHALGQRWEQIIIAISWTAC